ncbi:MAG: trypsin-like peptidase domain-containing protein [Ruthenibacterium lactatiformans]
MDQRQYPQYPQQPGGPCPPYVQQPGMEYPPYPPYGGQGSAAPPYGGPVYGQGGGPVPPRAPQYVYQTPGSMPGVPGGNRPAGAGTVRRWWLFCFAWGLPQPFFWRERLLTHCAAAQRAAGRPGRGAQLAIEDLPEDADGGLSTVEIAKTVGPSVVCINVYEPGSISIAGSGSGIILNEDGFIVTNAHVVEGSSAVTVLLDDGRELDAWIVGSDTRTDLAVVEITADGLVPASFGDSDILQVGERAVAIGNAAGQLSGTVTQGIISGLNREISMQAGNSVVTMNLIQTSAAINPGNSGGALVNRFGQVIGINSAKLNSSMFEGIGFAIPSADAQPVVEDLIAYGYVKDRVALGVMVIALSPVTGPANDLPSQGLYISSVEDYSDLNNHDITVGDVILTADGVTLETTSDLLDVLETHKPGETVRLEIQKRGSGNVVTVDAVLAESRSN